MNRLVKFIAGFAVAASLALPTAMAAGAEDKDVIDYRQNIMKTLDAQTASLGMIVSTQIPEDNLIQHAEAIALGAVQAKKSFEAKVAGGETLPDAWTNPDFMKRMDDFVAKTAIMAKSAREGGGPAVVVTQMVEALTCKGCHDLYRSKK
jgi:cytochrome c556